MAGCCIARPLAERFWEKVQKTEGCWLWLGCCKPKGRARFRIDAQQPMGYAARVSWELAYGPVPPGLHVLHHCDNPGCVRPDHLFLGTQADNVHDMERKGRGRKAQGTAHWAAKLSTEAVADIRQRYAAGGVTQQRLADEHGITQAHVSAIVRGQTRRSL